MVEVVPVEPFVFVVVVLSVEVVVGRPVVVEVVWLEEEGREVSGAVVLPAVVPEAGAKDGCSETGSVKVVEPPLSELEEVSSRGSVPRVMADPPGRLAEVLSVAEDCPFQPPGMTALLL